MNTKQKMIASGISGAALATAVLITVYEGHVLAETKTSKTELAAGTRATIASDGRTAVLAEIPASELATATREQLIARTTQQQQEIAMLRSKLLEGGADSRDNDPAWSPEPGRAWFDPSPDRLKLWAASCHIRLDEPGLSGTRPDFDDANRGIDPKELDAYKAALNEVGKTWKALVRSLYIEATGDVVGADTLSTDSMQHEIEEKSVPGEHARILYKLSHERAGMQAPPTDLSKTSPLERLMRARIKLGDQSEAAIAKRLGAERARAIRGDGWGSKSDSSGCPSED